MGLRDRIVRAIREAVRGPAPARDTRPDEPPAVTELPLFADRVPSGFQPIDLRTPAGEHPDDTRLLPPAVLFFHLSELPPRVALLGADAEVVRRLRQMGFPEAVGVRGTDGDTDREGEIGMENGRKIRWYRDAAGLGVRVEE